VTSGSNLADLLQILSSPYCRLPTVMGNLELSRSIPGLERSWKWVKSLWNWHL